MKNYFLGYPLVCILFASCSAKVDSVTPSSGLANGGDEITVRGRGFDPDAVVRVGEKECGSVSVNEEKDELTCTTPQHASGVFDITIDSQGKTLTLSQAFKYVSDLSISPLEAVISVGNSLQLKGLGGIKPYRFVLARGPGRIDEETGKYYAPGSVSSTSDRVVVKIYDSGDSTNAEANIVISSLLIPKVPERILAIQNEMTVSAEGGVKPYTFKALLGKIDSERGTYKAPSFSVTDVITVTDSVGASVQVSVQINDALRMTSPKSIYTVGNQINLAINGGVRPYGKVVLLEGGGTFVGNVFTPSVPGKAKFSVTDDYDNVSELELSVNPALQIFADSAVTIVNRPVKITAQGGIGAHIFHVSPEISGAEVNGEGKFVAPQTGSFTVKVIDEVTPPNVSEVIIEVTQSLSVYPATKIMQLSDPEELDLKVVDGIPPYSWKIVGDDGNMGELSSGTGSSVKYTAGGLIQNLSVEVADSTGTKATSVISLINFIPASLSAGANHQCATLSSGQARCWGLNDNGQLGQDNLVDRGLLPGSMEYTSVHFVQLETDGTLQPSRLEKISAGTFHTCAVSDGKVRCWGKNDNGQLGTGDKLSVTLSKTRVTTAVPNPLGVNFVDVASGRNFSCAVGDDGKVYCWGSNTNEQLGRDNASFPESLIPVEISGVTGAVEITAGDAHACVLKNNDNVMCWGGAGAVGGNNGGQTPRTISIGASDRAKTLSSGLNHACVVNFNDEVRCWGENNRGQLGRGNLDDDSSGSAFTLLDLSAKQVSAGGNHTCAILVTDQVKCWGVNSFGQAGQESAEARIGDEPGEMGINLEPVYLGAGRTASEVSVGGSHVCVRLNGDNEVKCWGKSLFGQLGLQNNSTNSIGDEVDEMTTLKTIDFLPK